MVPDFRFELFPLMRVPKDNLPSEPLTHLGLTLMRAVVEHTIIEWCEAEAWAINLLLRRDDGEFVFCIVLYYIVNAVRDNAELDATVDAIRSAVDPDLEEKTMTGMEILEKRGKEIGETNARTEIVQNMLDAGTSIDEVVRLTRIDRDFVQAVANGEAAVDDDAASQA